MDRILGMALQQQRERESARKPLVEFKAGMLTQNGTRIEADKRRGKVVVKMQDDLLHFQWYDRANPSDPVQDFILFPDSAQFKRLKSKKEERIYVLEFKNPRKLLFYWMQEPSTDKDDENAKKINEYIEKPPQANGQGTDQHSLMTGFGQRPSQGDSNQQGRSAVQVDQLNQILQSMGIPVPQSSQSGQSSQPSSQGAQSTQAQGASSQQSSQQNPFVSALAQQQQQLITLQDILSSEALVRFLRSQEEWKGLVEHLPEGSNADTHTMEEHATSPQFKQLLATFNEALMSGQLQGIMQSLGIEGTPLTAESFLNAINEKYGKKDNDEDRMED